MKSTGVFRTWFFISLVFGIEPMLREREREVERHGELFKYDLDSMPKQCTLLLEGVRERGRWRDEARKKNSYLCEGLHQRPER